MASAVRLCCAKMVCLLSMVLLAVGPVALFYLGLTYVSVYRTTSHYIQTLCDVSNMTSYAVCKNGCANKSEICSQGTKCSWVGKVNYESPTGGVVRGAVLYEGYDVMSNILRHNSGCSGTDCAEEDGSEEDGSAEESGNSDSSEEESGSGPDLESPDVVIRNVHLLGNASREIITCFVNPDDERHVLRSIPEGHVVLHMMLWPSLMIVIGLICCLVSKLCTREKC